LASVGISWYRLISVGIGWYQLVSVGISWYRLASVGIDWYQLVSVGISWYRLPCRVNTFNDGCPQALDPPLRTCIGWLVRLVWFGFCFWFLVLFYFDFVLVWFSLV